MAVVAKAGTFNKATSTGNQVVTHNLGITPKALIVWYADSFGGGLQIGGFGIRDASVNRCVGIVEVNAADPSNSDKRYGDAIISIINSSQTVTAQCSVSAWDSTSFTLDWTTNNASVIPLYYLIIGGDDVQAKIVDWQTGTSTGNLGVTGVGFQPSALIHLTPGGISGSPPQNAVHAELGIGFVDEDGNNRAVFIGSWDNQATSDAGRYQISAASIKSNPADAAGWVIQHISYDSDGFTVNVTTAPGVSREITTLCLSGLRTKVGVFDKSTSLSTPVSQTIQGLGIKPVAVMLMSVMAAASASIQTHARFALGAADGSYEGCITWKAEDNSAAADADAFSTETEGVTKVIQISDNDLFYSQGGAIQAEADMSSLNNDGFTLSWTTNNATATEIIYFVLGTILEVTDTVTITDVANLTAKELAITDTVSITDLAALIVYITDTVGISETVSLPAKVFTVTDTVTISELVAMAVYIQDNVTITDEIDIGVLIQIADAVGVSESVVVAVLVAIAEGVTITDIVGRFAPITDTVTVAEIIGLAKSMPRTEQVTMTESVMVMKQNNAVFAEPEEYYFTRNRHRYTIVYQARKIR